MRRIFLVKLSVLVLFCFANFAAAQTNEFTYQGKLTDSGTPSTTYDFEFRLCTAESSGDCSIPVSEPNGVLLETKQRSGVAVTNGIFTVKLDYLAVHFTGADRFLEIRVRRNGGENWVTLSPRQKITSSPYSLKSVGATSADSLSNSCVLCVTDAQIQTIDGGKITGTVANAATAANISGVVGVANGGTGSSTQNFVDLSTNQTVGGDKTFSGILSGNGAGLTNVPGTFKWQTISGFTQQAQPNNGYLSNNFELVTITLPAAPNIGDIIRVTGIGAGGWKIAQNNNQAVVGLALDLTGIYWQAREDFRTWTGVASSADGAKLVAVGEFERIYTSTDSGASWTPRENTRRWNAVASSNNGNRLVAVVRNGRIYVSTDSGVNWTATENNRAWVSVASSADGLKLAAVADSEQIYVSSNGGVTWTAHETMRDWVSVASSADGTKLIAAVEGGQLYVSGDSGATWTPRETKRNWRGVASSADGTKLVAVEGIGRIYVSNNSGVTWIPRETDRFWNSAASSADGTKLVATDGNGQIYTSNDSGASWTASGGVFQWSAVATSADGEKIIAAARFDKLFTSSRQTLETTTAGTAGYLFGGLFTSVELQYIGNNLFLLINSKGTVYGF